MKYGQRVKIRRSLYFKPERYGWVQKGYGEEGSSSYLLMVTPELEFATRELRNGTFTPWVKAPGGATVIVRAADVEIA